MTHRATFSLDDTAFNYLNSAAGSNRSAYINRLLKEEEQRKLAQDILKANQEEGDDLAYQEELSHWDAALGDGLS